MVSRSGSSASRPRGRGPCDPTGRRRRCATGPVRPGSPSARRGAWSSVKSATDSRDGRSIGNDVVAMGLFLLDGAWMFARPSLDHRGVKAVRSTRRLRRLRAAVVPDAVHRIRFLLVISDRSRSATTMPSPVGGERRRQQRPLGGHDGRVAAPREGQTRGPCPGRCRGPLLGGQEPRRVHHEAPRLRGRGAGS